MKKTIALLLTAGLLAALLAGCSQTASTSSAPASEAPSASEPEPSPSAEPTPEPTPSEAPAAGEYTPGTRTDTGYESEALGLQFTLGENMVMASDEEINSLMGQAADLMYEDPETGEQILDTAQLTVVYEMMAADVTTGSNAIIAAEKLPLANLTEEQYIAAMEQQMAQTTMSIDFGEPSPVTLGNTEFLSLQYETDAGNGAVMQQNMLLKKIGDRMMLITLSAPDQAGLDALLACFAPLDTAV